MDPTEEPLVAGAEGELSKNAAKKKAKADEALRKKQEKEAAKAAQKAAEPAAGVAAPKRKLGGEDEAELDPTQYNANRQNAMLAYEVSCTPIASCHPFKL